MIGIGKNEWAQGVPSALAHYCEINKISHQVIELKNIRDIDLKEITHLSPALLYLKPEAEYFYEKLESSGVIALNPINSMRKADDKSWTYKVLYKAGVEQIETEIIDLQIEEMQNYFKRMGQPVVFKRRYGGQGRWVRTAFEGAEIPGIYREFFSEGPGPILAQPLIEEAFGRTIRVIVTAGKVLASSLRTSENDWRSNISLGSTQIQYELSDIEVDLSLRAVAALNLGHAGVDLIQTNSGSQVLEVNACPDFTSMKDVTSADIAGEVIQATLRAKGR